MLKLITNNVFIFVTVLFINGKYLKETVALTFYCRIAQICHQKINCDDVYSIFRWITNCSDYRSVRFSFLGKYIVRKRFAVQKLLYSLEFIIHSNLEYGTIAVSNLTPNVSVSKSKPL